MRILYVEDNQANVFLVKRVARMGQHEVINYIDGEEVLKKFEAINPDLVLMDIQLAGEMTGLDAVKYLRERGYRTPIIAVTAYAMVGDRERCIEAGCDDYLPKPLPVQRLIEIFEQYGKAKPAVVVAATPVPEPTPIAPETPSITTPEATTASPTPTPESTPVATEPATVVDPQPSSEPVAAMPTEIAATATTTDPKTDEVVTSTPTDPSAAETTPSDKEPSL